MNKTRVTMYLFMLRNISLTQIEFYVSLGCTFSPYRPSKWKAKLAEIMPEHHRIVTRQVNSYDAKT